MILLCIFDWSCVFCGMNMVTIGCEATATRDILDARSFPKNPLRGVALKSSELEKSYNGKNKSIELAPDQPG
jgi:hypothetical protein